MALVLFDVTRMFPTRFLVKNNGVGEVVDGLDLRDKCVDKEHEMAELQKWFNSQLRSISISYQELQDIRYRQVLRDRIKLMAKLVR